MKARGVGDGFQCLIENVFEFRGTLIIPESGYSGLKSKVTGRFTKHFKRQEVGGLYIYANRRKMLGWDFLKCFRYTTYYAKRYALLFRAILSARDGFMFYEIL